MKAHYLLFNNAVSFLIFVVESMEDLLQAANMIGVGAPTAAGTDIIESPDEIDEILLAHRDQSFVVGDLSDSGVPILESTLDIFQKVLDLHDGASSYKRELQDKIFNLGPEEKNLIL